MKIAFWQLLPEQMSAAVVPGAELSILSAGLRPNVGDAPVLIRYWSSVYAGPFIVSAGDPYDVAVRVPAVAVEHAAGAVAGAPAGDPVVDGLEVRVPEEVERAVHPEAHHDRTLDDRSRPGRSGEHHANRTGCAVDQRVDDVAGAAGVAVGVDRLERVSRAVGRPRHAHRRALRVVRARLPVVRVLVHLVEVRLYARVRRGVGALGREVVGTDVDLARHRVEHGGEEQAGDEQDPERDHHREAVLGRRAHARATHHPG